LRPVDGCASGDPQLQRPTESSTPPFGDGIGPTDAADRSTFSLIPRYPCQANPL